MIKTFYFKEIVFFPKTSIFESIIKGDKNE